MARVLLLQLDGKLPNVALMRLAAHHRARGDETVLRKAGSESAACRELGVDTDGGRRLVLAPDEDYAERAIVRHYGDVSRPRSIDGPIQFPLLPIAGWGQYLDAVHALEGDPARPVVRAPDSSPALSPELAFIDAMLDPQVVHVRDTSSMRSQQRRIDAWERMHASRLRHLRSVGSIGARDGDPGPQWDGRRWRA